jgi:hypothetical protein
MSSKVCKFRKAFPAMNTQSTNQAEFRDVLQLGCYQLLILDKFLRVHRR